jgi:mono/diheme cytochrome c family protein
VSFVALLWLIIDVYRGGPDGNEHLVWDETLREGAKPAPIWWFWFILALMTISVVYVILYPGLGTYRGALGWSMGGRIEERYVDYEGQFGTQRKLILKLPLAEIAGSDSAMRSAWRVFNNNCSSCHGRDAAGQVKAFPDLTDAAWQWGSDDSQVIATIGGGRQAAMPGWTAVVGPEGVEQLASYVLAHVPWPGGGLPPWPRAARCSSSTARPATDPLAPAMRCWVRRHSMTLPGTTAASAPTCWSRSQTGGAASCRHSAPVSMKRKYACWPPG